MTNKNPLTGLLWFIDCRLTLCESFDSENNDLGFGCACLLYQEFDLLDRIFWQPVIFLFGFGHLLHRKQFGDVVTPVGRPNYIVPHTDYCNNFAVLVACFCSCGHFVSPCLLPYYEYSV